MAELSERALIRLIREASAARHPALFRESAMIARFSAVPGQGHG